MAGKKRKVSGKVILNKPELLYIINKIPSQRNQALICFIYMTGCRISEIVGTKKRIKHYIKDNGKYILDDNKHRRYDGIEEVEVWPLVRENIEILWDKQLMLVHNVACLKRSASLPIRIIPIYIPKVREFFDIFYRYFSQLKPGQPLFKITRQRAWQIVRKNTGLFNHFFIHERLTHLVTHEEFSDQDLKMFRGWSSTMPANSYVHMRWQDLARKQGAIVEDSNHTKTQNQT